MIYFTSDLHFGHDKEFIYKNRGFNSIEEHDKAIIDNWNNMITYADDVYILGDLMLNNNEEGIAKLRQLNGNLHIYRGNHDTDNRFKIYQELEWNRPYWMDCLWEINDKYADMFKYGKYRFYISHYPTLTSNGEDFDKISQHIINLHGHTHSKNKIYVNNPYMYNVALDAHNMKPVLIEDIIKDIEDYVNKNREYYK